MIIQKGVESCDLILELFQYVCGDVLQVLGFTVLFQPRNGTSRQLIEVAHTDRGVEGQEETVAQSFEHFQLDFVVQHCWRWWSGSR